MEKAAKDWILGFLRDFIFQVRVEIADHYACGAMSNSGEVELFENNGMIFDCQTVFAKSDLVLSN